MSAMVVLAVVGWCAGAIVLAQTLAAFLLYAAHALHDPYGLNYAEGLIWQQALLIPGAQMYGGIDHVPFLVFEYPPLYHLVVRAVAAGGMDMLKAGRLVSLVSTVALACTIGMLAALCSAPYGRRSRALAGITGASLMFTLVPVLAWAVLMRVDDLALALSFGGLALACLSFRSSPLLYPAVLLFVAAMFTKQTCIAAPISVLVVAGWRTPLHAAKAFGTGLLVGLILLAALCWTTHGGFVQHILLYNINRFSLFAAMAQTAKWVVIYPIYCFGTIAAIALHWRTLELGRTTLPSSASFAAPTAVLLLAFLGVSGIMLVLAGKNGAGPNYFIEFLCAWCIWLGVLAAIGLNALMLCRRAKPNVRAGFVACAIPILLLLQMAPLPAALAAIDAETFDRAKLAVDKSLLERVRATSGAVLSDDMVLVMRAGRGVTIEPAIFAELAATGRWNNHLLLTMLDAHDFAAIVTAGGHGDAVFDDRYLPETQAAIERNYKHVTRYGDYRLMLP